ncbi:MAG: hypothetical protein KJ058_01855 [Thermoanaerobaculia bacterium]|nr:hypothetical protein [Thermoanaerobaculia bacterium]MCZ7649827.1 hypothetical protein [Thermoanaerobaculia bacterium]
MWIGLLVLAGVAVALYALLWLAPRLRRESARKEKRRQTVARERELDLEACRTAAASMAASSIADDKPASRRPGDPVVAETEVARRAVDNRRRAATSTSFDPDLPGS